jgi:predicted RNA-binding protein (virulence factor B family)
MSKPIIGRRNTLRVSHESVPGLFLDGGELGDILLPRRYIPENLRLGAKLDVFVYLDSEDRLVATTETPLAQAGECACLRVASADRRLGAFLDWGLSKDLLLPIREQHERVVAGEEVVVFIYLDKASGRLVASSRLENHLNRQPPTFRVGDRVDLLIARDTPLGYVAVINGTHTGLLYHSETGTRLKIGLKTPGYVRELRADGKICLRLHQAGYGRIAPLADRILAKLKASGGRLDFDDASTAEVIQAAFGVSKKAFKQALGALYRERCIRFARGGIELGDGQRKAPATPRARPGARNFRPKRPF